MNILNHLENKKRKLVIIIAAIIMLVLLVFASLSILPFYKSIKNEIVENKVEKYRDEDGGSRYDEYEIILCKFDLYNPEYIFVDRYNDQYYEYFLYKLGRDNIFSQEFKRKWDGGGDIQNTTFSQLTKMAKDDCEQFRQSYPSPTNPRKDDDDTDISWIYNPPPTDKEIAEQERLVEMRRERNEREQKEAREGNYLLFEEYADIYNSLSDDEIILLTDLEQNEDYNEYEIGLWMKENGYTDREINWDYIDYYRYDDSDEDEVWNKINSRYRSVFPDGFINEE